MSRVKLAAELILAVVGLAMAWKGFTLPATLAEVYAGLQLAGLVMTGLMMAAAAVGAVAIIRSQRQPPYIDPPRG